MRGKVAKRIRRWAKEDTPDLQTEVVYTTIQQSNHSANSTVVLGECIRRYYKLLKYLYKLEKQVCLD